MKSSFRFGCPAISRWYKDITSSRCHDVMLSLHFNVLNEEQTVRQWNLQVHGSQYDRMVWVACGQNFSWVLHEADFNPWKASVTEGHRYWSDWCRLATLLCQGQVNICRTTCDTFQFNEHHAARFAEWNGQERKWHSTNKGCFWASAFQAPPRNVAAHSHSPNLKHSYNDNKLHAAVIRLLIVYLWTSTSAVQQFCIGSWLSILGGSGILQTFQTADTGPWATGLYFQRALVALCCGRCEEHRNLCC